MATQSGRKALTALGTTTGQHLTAVFGGHTGAEAMLALALEVTGLKSTFHDTPLPGLGCPAVIGLSRCHFGSKQQVRNNKSEPD